MTETPQDTPNPEHKDLIFSLRRKEGTWVEWGQACQTLQKAGFQPQEIFEETGFEPIQQNQVIVGAQVYSSMVSNGVSEAAREYFERRGSEILYELRILTQPERAAAAELIVAQSLDVEASRHVAKAIKDFSRLGKLPEGFTNHPGDATAYYFWKLAKQKADLQERSRLIAQGLRFAQSPTARQHVEKLLTDFSVVSAQPAPRLPVYRLETSDELPRVLPIAGKMPLTLAQLQAVMPVQETGPFKIIHSVGNQAWVPIPGWQVLRQAEDPIVILCDSEQLPSPLPGKPEEVLVIVDRTQQEWDANNYFLVEAAGQLQLQWFPESPDVPIIGRVILIMRPKKVLDEEFTKDPWQIDE